MTTFFFILEKWTRVFPSLLLLFLEQKMENGENAPIFSDKISISSDVCKIPREENKIPREEIGKMSDKIA